MDSFFSFFATLLELFVEWRRGKTNKGEHISIPDLLAHNKIEFSYRKSKQIGCRIINGKSDLFNYKLFITQVNIEAIKEKKEFDGSKDVILFYILDGVDKKQKLLMGVVDPVELYDNPYLLKHHIYTKE